MAPNATGPEGELNPKTRELLRTGGALQAWPEARQHAVWAKAVERAGRPQRRWLPIVAVAAALALVLIVVATQRAPAPTLVPTPNAKPGWTELSLNEAGKLLVATGAHVRQSPQNPTEIAFDSGSLRAEIHHRPASSPVVITTPHLRIIDIGTLFRVEVTPESTQVAVDEGRVRVEKGVRFVEVAAGESIRSDDPRLAALAPAPAPTPAASTPAVVPTPPPLATAPVPAMATRPSTSPLTPSLTRQQAAIPKCESHASGAERDACYEQLASGSGLDAQSALVALALEKRDRGDHAGAIAALRSYQQRFAAGLFAPEVGIELVLELDDGTPGSSASAVDAASAFERQYGRDPRAPRVSLVRARLLRAELGKPAEALAIVQGVVGSTQPTAIRDEALFELGLCQVALHRDAEATATWERYLRELPQGHHADEVRAARDATPP